MAAAFHYIEAQIRYLLTEEGGRRTGVCSGYRGQFYYNGDDHDGFQFFPDNEDGIALLGVTARTLVQFSQERWEEVHSKHIAVGTRFEIREGNRTVGHGVVTNLDADPPELRV